MCRSRVKTKKDFYRRWLLGEFGNRLRSWEDASLITCPYVNVRQITSCKDIQYNVPKGEVPVGPQYRYNEPAPDNDLLIQGEVYLGHRGIELTFSQEKCKMRTAMQNPIFVHGIKAQYVLMLYCCPSSYSDLQALFELYPGHVIEFGVYNHNLGDVPNRNTIIWEVRSY